MKFNLNVQSPLPVRRRAEVGDVYPAKGGRGDTRYWIVLSINARGYASVIGLDEEGHIVSGQTYGSWAFEDRPLLGRCAGIESMSFDIEWEPKL